MLSFSTIPEFIRIWALNDVLERPRNKDVGGCVQSLSDP